MRKILKNNIASGFGTICILFPIVVVTICGLVNYSLYDTSIQVKETYRHIEPIEVEVEEINESEINSELPFGLNMAVGWLKWFTTQIADVYVNMADALDFIDSGLKKYLLMDYPLMEKAGELGVALKVICVASIGIGIAEICLI